MADTENLVCDKIVGTLKKPNIGTCHVVPLTKSFKYNKDDILYAVNIIFKNFDIEITISSHQPVFYDQLFNNFLYLYEFIMLLLGYFPDINTLYFLNSNIKNNSTLNEKSKISQESLLRCYSSFIDIKKNCTALIDFSSFNIGKAFTNWIIFKNKYSFQHKLYLYTTSNMEFLIDIRLALLSQIFEPLFEHIVNEKFIENGKEKTTFKKVLEKTISKYCELIFKLEEDNSTLNSIIDKIKANRNQIFHIAPKPNKVPSSDEYLCYFHKINLLYRHALLDKLEIDLNIYRDKIIELTSRINSILN